MITTSQDTARLPENRCREAAAFLRERCNRTPRAGIILGTGLGQFAAHIQRDVVIPFAEIPHFPRATALGHKGQLVCGVLNNIPVLVLEGRFHCYEGYSCEDITLPVEVVRHLGAELLLISNASGGLNPRLRSGDIMLISDHINWMGRRTACLAARSRVPCRGDGGRPYHPELIDLAQEVARRNGFACPCGTYMGVLGPNYETRAEYRAMRRVGADAVGMSTIPEALAALRCGLKVLAMSTVTNVACPDAPGITKAEDVIDIAATAEPKLRKIVMGVLDGWFAARGSALESGLSESQAPDTRVLEASR